jgi:ribosomal protein L9
MTGWDVLNNTISGFPPVAMALLLAGTVVAMVVFIVGFSRHGVDFVKHGFKQNFLNEFLANLATKEDIAGLRAEFKSSQDKLRAELKGSQDELRAEFKGLQTELRTEFKGLQTEFEAIKVNHFGHLKDFLTELTSILVDRNVINNQDKTRLDNKLRGM